MAVKTLWESRQLCDTASSYCSRHWLSKHYEKAASYVTQPPVTVAATGCQNIMRKPPVMWHSLQLLKPPLAVKTLWESRQLCDTASSYCSRHWLSKHYEKAASYVTQPPVTVAATGCQNFIRQPTKHQSFQDPTWHTIKFIHLVMKGQSRTEDKFFQHESNEDDLEVLGEDEDGSGANRCRGCRSSLSYLDLISTKECV